MRRRVIHQNRAAINFATKLFIDIPWLNSRFEKLLELVAICDSQDKMQLMQDLLYRFEYVNDGVVNSNLKRIARFIIDDCEFRSDTTQIVALAWDDSADSSQAVLQALKVVLWELGWRQFITVNRVPKVPRSVANGRTQVVIVDEFVGSGRTIKTRIEWLCKNVQGNFQLKICFLAGMTEAIEEIQANGYDVFCPLSMTKGIRDSYVSPHLEKAITAMEELESTLADVVGTKQFSEFSFGYGQAEALYSSPVFGGNVPNNVFPIFWWPQLTDGTERNTLFTRYEEGLL